MNALVFLYKHVLKQPLSGEINADRARKQSRIPVVLTREETARVIVLMSGVYQLIVKLLYGSGLRITECLRLRIQDIDLEMKALTVRNGKGDKDRITTFPEMLVHPLKEHCKRVELIHSSPATRYGHSHHPGPVGTRGRQYHHDLHPRLAARWPRSHEPTGRSRHRVLTPSRSRSSSATPHRGDHGAQLQLHGQPSNERRGGCQGPEYRRVGTTELLTVSVGYS